MKYILGETTKVNPMSNILLIEIDYDWDREKFTN